MMLDARHGLDEAAIRELSRVGFGDPLDPAESRLLSLLSVFALRLQLGRALDGCAWIAAAVWEPRDGPEGTSGGDVFSGAGFRPADAIRSCLGEFAEFQSWLFRPGDATRRGVDAARSIDPWSVLGFSEQQRMQDYDDIPSSATFAGEIDWSAAVCLNDGLPAWIPSQLCHGRYAERTPAPRSMWRNDSNGCAAGATAEDARLAALLELIERDATGIWWYGRCRRPGIDPATLSRPALQAAIDARRQRGQSVHLLDLTHDLQVPVVAAILIQDEQLRGLGVGCKPSFEAAAASAYLELCQMELAITLATQRASVADVSLLNWLERVNVKDHPYLTPAGISEAMKAPEPTFDELVRRLLSGGLRTYAVDLQREDIGIPAVRLFVPGLCHYKPRLGFPRLTEVPKMLGWREQSFRDLNATPLMM